MSSDRIGTELDRLRSELSEGTQLIAVSKMRSIEEIASAYLHGQRDFGENKVQELSDKAQILLASCPDIRWHFIGHLQSNKINQLLQTPGLVAIHSVDRSSLLDKLIVKDDSSRRIGLFLQVNTSLEEEKSGLESLDEIDALIAKFTGLTGFWFQGLMTIGKIRTENFEQDARRCFAMLKTLRDDIQQKDVSRHLELSMGMSSDYKIALEYQTDWIRIGTQIFGERKVYV